jgi:hypothetical protein
MLTRILAQHIERQEPAVHIIGVFGWPLEKVSNIGGWQAYLQHEKGWVQSRKTIFIFDEAQLSYEDFNLWNEFFKSVADYPNLFVIAFASYGSPTSRLLMFGTPFTVKDSQKVTLRPIQHADHLGVGLLFSRIEFDELVQKKFSSSDYYFHPSFFDGVFDITRGHVGAILDFVEVIRAVDVRCFMMSEHIT